jgi:hypothetical protein
MTDRTPCLNPRCRRTFKSEHVGETVVCGKCWKLLPVAARQRDKQLRRRMRLIERMAAKGNEFRRRGRHHGQPSVGAPQAYTMGAKFDRLWHRHWDRVTAFFLAPEKPTGLDAFLEEVGL